MDWNILWGIVCLLLILALWYTVARLLRVREQLLQIQDALTDIKNGNLNRRVLARKSDMTRKICYDINRIAVNDQAKLVAQRQSEQAYKRLMTSLSHDVKTPLTSLMGYLEAIQTGVVLGKERDDYLWIAYEKARHLSAFVQSLFEWVKLDSGEQIFHFEEQDICELTRDILADWIVGLPYRDKKLFSKYSLGMKQRLGIANAILHDPELLILDEPTNGLDPIGIAEMRNFILSLSKERGKTILISSHILSEIAMLADDIGIIHGGVLLEESSFAALERKNRKYIQIQVSDPKRATLVLEQQFGLRQYEIEDDACIRLYDTDADIAAINKALMLENIAVISSQMCNDSLEDYFKKVTGGEGIA